MREFVVIPTGPDLEVDFKVNMPLDIFRAFAIFKNGKAVHSQSLDISNPYGQTDYAVPAATAQGGVLSCRFDCLGKLSQAGQQVKITLVLSQGNTRKEYSLIPVTLKAYDNIISQIRKDVWVKIVREDQ